MLVLKDGKEEVLIEARQSSRNRWVVRRREKRMKGDVLCVVNGSNKG